MSSTVDLEILETITPLLCTEVSIATASRGMISFMLTQQTSYPGGQDLSQYHPGDKGGLYLTAGRSEPQVLDFLQQKQLPQLALCGGASVYQKFLSHDWVDELYLSIEPIVFGSGLRLFPDLSQLQRYQVLEVIKLSSQTHVWHLKR